MNRNLSADQFGEPFRDPDEPFTYTPDRMRPRSARANYLVPFDPNDDAPDVGPMSGRVN